MKNKFFFVSGLIIIFSLFVSCASTSMYKVDPVPGNSVSGKTVFLEIAMAEWDRKVFPLMDAGIYNKGLGNIEEEINKIQSQKIVDLLKQASNQYKNLFNVEIGYDKYPMPKEFEITYFSKNPSADTIKAITQICNKNSADYLFALVGQMKTETIYAFGSKGANILSFDMVLFDKTGKPITKGEVKTKEIKMQREDASIITEYFDEAAIFIEGMINNMKK